MRAEDMLYAAAVAVLLAWLVFSAGSGSNYAPDPERPAARALRGAAPVPGASPAPPRVAAEATIDGVPFHILVGEGPPAFGVAVSAAEGRPAGPGGD